MIDMVYVSVNKGLTYTVDTNEYFYFIVEGSFLENKTSTVELQGLDDVNKILLIKKSMQDGSENEILEIFKKKTLSLSKGSAIYIIKGSVSIDKKEYPEKTWINIVSGDMKKTLIPKNEAIILLTKNPIQT